MAVVLKIDLDVARRVFLLAVTAQILFAVLHLGGAFAEASLGEAIRAYGLFDMDREANLPAWFSGAILLVIGLVAVLISRLRESTPPPSRKFFGLTGLLFMFLSADEVAAIHEKITKVTTGLDWVPHFPGHRGVWVFLYLPLGLILLALAYRHVIALWRSHRSESLILLAGLSIYLVGTAGLDVFAIYYFPEGGPSLAYRVQVACEESLEMLGANLLLFAFLRLFVRMSGEGREKGNSG